MGAVGNAFALDLHATLARGASGGNTFVSPYSLLTVLAMAAEGARGETAREIGSAMRLADSARRKGPPGMDRPWDLAMVHASLGEATRAFALGTQQQSPAARARADDVRARSIAADAAGVRAMQVDDHASAFAHDTEARQLRRELRELETGLNAGVLFMANAVWGEASYPFAPEWLGVIDEHHGAGCLRPEDFRGAPEQARQHINAWAVERTAGRIRDLVRPGAVTHDTRLVLTSAIYFNGEWVEPFFRANARPGEFRTAEGTSVNVPFMRRHASARYAAFDDHGRLFNTPRAMSSTRSSTDEKAYYPDPGGFQLAELAYKGGVMAMLVVLPMSHDGLPALEKVFTIERLDSWIGSLETRDVHVVMPKFRLALDRNLTGDLDALGMRRAFVDPITGSGANFSGMTSSSDPKDALYVSAVVQKAFVDVHERGTEAAAATAVVIGETMSASPPFDPLFRADRPFLFLIRHVPTGAILFIGRYARPD